MTDPTAPQPPESPQESKPNVPPTPNPWAQEAPNTEANAAPRRASSETPPHEPGWERAVLEKLAFATLEEQRRARRWKVFFRFAWLLVVLAVGAVVLYENTPGADVIKPHTALVEIKGEIAADTPANADDIVDSMRSALEDEGAKALVLRIDSPGGSPVQAGIINDEIVRLRAKYQKPVYVVVGETCASAAYYIASAADEIYVDKASIVGSIGVLMDGFGFTGAMEKLGIERRLLTAGENKGFLDPFSPVQPKQVDYARTMVAEIHQQFIDVVRKGRGKRLKETPDMFSGLFWSGAQAVELGLADGFGTVNSVARNEFKTEDIVDYTKHEGLPERVLKKFGASIGAAAGASVLDSIVSKPALR